MTPQVIELINLKLNKKWSPEQISGWLELNESFTISHETVYQDIWRDNQRGDMLFTALRRKCKKYQSPHKNKQSGRGFIKNRVSIDERPQVVDDRSRIGDWKIYLVKC
jgi:IS30 family transposase